MHNLEQKGDIFIVDNFGYEQQIDCWAEHPQLLHKINTDKIVSVVLCQHLREVNEGKKFCGAWKEMLVPRDGKMTYLVSEVELNSMT